MIKDKVLNDEDCKSLFSLEEERLAPGESFSEEEYNSFIKDYKGKTVYEYCEHRWPDHPEKQLRLAKSVLTN